ncbi:MAG: hypothetical protein R3B70_08295 [Polyangiaceae bacterium]
MSARSLRERAVAAALALIALAAPADALAQACCAGASALGNGRLAPHEDALVGLTLRATDFHGSMTHDGAYAAAPDGVSDIELQQELVGTMRIFEHGQLTAIVPVLETFRSVPGLSEMGGGLGDVQLGARYDFIEPGASPRWPGIALAWSLTLPTGVSPEEASQPLATDATGTGALAASGQVVLERGFGDAFVQLSGGAEWRSPRVVADLHTQRGPTLSTFGAAGYSFSNGVVAALTLVYRAELPARIEGVTVPDSGSELTRAGVSMGYSLDDDWRIQAGFVADLPVAPLSRNLPAGVGLSFTLIRSSW